jgi:RimJ/RimL family protein N-acetyltransferase
MSRAVSGGRARRPAEGRGPGHAVGVIETLETERLVLRPFGADDLDDLCRLHAEPSFWWFPLRRAMRPEETATFMDRQIADYASRDHPGFHAVVERDGGALVGWAGLSVPTFLPEVLPAVEVGWRLGERFRGRGYATEAAAASLGWGFGPLGLDSVLSIFEPENVRSGQVMDRLGFDAGFETTHPDRGLPLRVRTLTAADWATGTAGPS